MTQLAPFKVAAGTPDTSQTEVVPAPSLNSHNPVVLASTVNDVRTGSAVARAGSTAATTASEHEQIQANRASRMIVLLRRWEI
jgi:hypothetical protein